MARPEMARSLHSTTSRRLAAADGVRVERDHEVPLLRAEHVAGGVRGALQDVVRATQGVRQEVLHEVLEVRALGCRTGALGRPRRGRRFDGGEAVVEVLEALAHLGPELVQRRSQPRRVEQLCEPGSVTVEEGAQEEAHPADGGIAPLLVEQLAGEGPQLATVAEERLEGARQPAIPVGEVRAQDLVDLGREAVVERFGLADHGLELSAHGINVERGTGILQSGQPDAQGALQQRDAVALRAVADERGQARIDECEVPRRQGDPRPTSTTWRSRPAAGSWRIVAVSMPSP